MSYTAHHIYVALGVSLIVRVQLSNGVDDNILGSTTVIDAYAPSYSDDNLPEVDTVKVRGEIPTEASAILDEVSTTEPSGRAALFREMIVQLYMRFFNKTTLDSNDLKVYDIDGDVNTSQSVSDINSTQTINKA